ncbi:hypothetical protein WA026_005706 [Henosepilachna vigintioctopunctata]|uniref:Uncharacterized protein n=1 Tax=Henosepilachna vigintioctopunctata TaxID=420089 RepID=A0AAW1TVU2_9CUCU
MTFVDVLEIIIFEETMKISTLKKNFSLVPLLFIVGGGVIAAISYTARVAMYHPEVVWIRNGKNWRDYETKPYRKLWWYIDNSIADGERSPGRI